MCTRVNRVVRWFAIVVATISIFASPFLVGVNSASANANTAADQEVKRRGSDDWVPAFALTGAFHGHAHKSKVSSSCDIGGPGDGIGLLVRCSQAGELGRSGPLTAFDTPNVLRSPADDSSFTLWPTVGVDFQIMSPTLIELPYDIKPRAWGAVEISAAFPPERTIANEANLTQLTLPESLSDPTSYPTGAISGLGSEVASKVGTFMYGAQAGLAFPIQFGTRKVRIKPSFGWIQYRLKVEGRVLSALKDDVNGDDAAPPFVQPSAGSRVREIDLRDSVNRTFNGIGPGIEIELESGQFGNIGAAMFASAQAYKILGKKKIKLSDTVTKADGSALGPGEDGLLEDTYRAKWEHEVDPWMFRFKVGIRFHYLGK
jgi:hypothetical protein